MENGKKTVHQKGGVHWGGLIFDYWEFQKETTDKRERNGQKKH